MKVGVIGAGAFGTALGGLLADKGYDIDYYDSRIERERLSDVVAGAGAIVLAVPSVSAPHVSPHLPTATPLIVATKGILSDEAFDKFDDWMVLSGPGFAEDIKARKTTHLTASDRRVVEMFGTEYIDFDLTADRRGMLMCGALKNVYAILAGFLDLKPVSREHRKFLADAAGEMRAILKENGADPATVDLNCGRGDLKITCGYPSRNYEFGVRARTEGLITPDKTVEGVSALRRIRRSEIFLPDELELLTRVIEESKKWG